MIRREDTNFTMKDENLEKCIHEKNPIRLDTACIQEYRFWRSIKTVAVQDWLNHNQRLSQVFSHKHMPGNKIITINSFREPAASTVVN